MWWLSRCLVMYQCFLVLDGTGLSLPSGGGGSSLANPGSPAFMSQAVWGVETRSLLLQRCRLGTTLALSFSSSACSTSQCLALLLLSFLSSGMLLALHSISRRHMMSSTLCYLNVFVLWQNMLFNKIYGLIHKQHSSVVQQLKQQKFVG